MGFDGFHYIDEHGDMRSPVFRPDDPADTAILDAAFDGLAGTDAWDHPARDDDPDARPDGASPAFVSRDQLADVIRVYAEEVRRCMDMPEGEDAARLVGRLLDALGIPHEIITSYGSSGAFKGMELTVWNRPMTGNA